LRFCCLPVSSGLGGFRFYLGESTNICLDLTGPCRTYRWRYESWVPVCSWGFYVLRSLDDWLAGLWHLHGLATFGVFVLS
jgi:hypothetical protein